ncbi:hypothetical protein VTK73DRAFT_8166 [Phialemonium thermophilum]|uniref:Uncharacterized protein n=1 Tax=Phialemonium thermophilum TaxID=223376 RepID=A0ABR3W9S7_9PEZI
MRSYTKPEPFDAARLLKGRYFPTSLWSSKMFEPWFPSRFQYWNWSLCKVPSVDADDNTRQAWSTPHGAQTREFAESKVTESSTSKTKHCRFPASYLLLLSSWSAKAQADRFIQMRQSPSGPA